MPYPSKSEEIQPYGPLVTFRTLEVVPPSALYVSRDDSIVLAIHNPTVAVTVNVSVRWLSPQGQVIPELYTFTNPISGATTTEFPIKHPEGFILSASLFGNNSARGQCFTRLFIRRGAGSQDTTIGHILCQGYVALDDFLGYPQSPTESSISGRGNLRSITIAAPAPGAEVTQTVPAGVRWILRSFLVFLGTSATVATRVPQLRVRDPSLATGIQVPVPLGVVASQSTSVTWGAGNSSVGLANAQSVGFPAEVILGPGWVFGTLTINIQAADTYTSPIALVEEYVGK